MGVSEHWRVPARRLRSAGAQAMLLVGAIVPALALVYLHSTASSTGLSDRPVFRILLLTLPVSTFLLAIFLWQARSRILHLETKEAEAVQTAGLDPLSGLPNRLFFERLLENAIAQSTLDAPIALISIDIDKFKSVNDSHGHQAGDRLIVGIAERIKRIIREGDCLARVGGDEFALMLINIGSMAKCAAMAHRVHDAMLAPFDIGQAQVFATLSLGVRAVTAGRRDPREAHPGGRSRALSRQTRRPQPLRFLRQDDGAEAAPRPDHRGRPARGDQERRADASSTSR